MTGSTSRTIHSGRVCEVAKPWTSLRRLASFLRICLERVVRHLLFELLLQLGESRRVLRSALMASAPMPAMKVSPYCSSASRILGLGQELALLQRRLARIDDEVILVIDDALEMPGWSCRA